MLVFGIDAREEKKLISKSIVFVPNCIRRCGERSVVLARNRAVVSRVETRQSGGGELRGTKCCSISRGDLFSICAERRSPLGMGPTVATVCATN